MDSLEVVSERVKEHDRRIEGIEAMSKDTARGAAALLVVTERHSEQLAVLMRVVYGGLGIAVTAVMGILIKGR